jgi:hypothetical protein
MTQYNCQEVKMHTEYHILVSNDYKKLSIAINPQVNYHEIKQTIYSIFHTLQKEEMLIRRLYTEAEN